MKKKKRKIVSKTGFITILLLAISLTLFAQNNSKILLVYTNFNDCDNTCKSDLETFRTFLKTSLNTSGLFQDSISYTTYRREDMLKTFIRSCHTKDVEYYLLSTIPKNGNNSNKGYKINFELYDLKKEIITNKKFKFDIDPDQPGRSVENIMKTLQAELNYFAENNYKFKPLVNIETFDNIDPDNKTEHIKDFPKWLTEKLNEHPSTNKVYRYHYVGGSLNEMQETNILSGRLTKNISTDSLKVIFWMDNNTDEKVDIIIYSEYKDENKAIKNAIIKKVMEILNKRQ
ncbi:MAG: hypothetical protein K8R68_03645 [Bacteroidales bacterium]|nr:hypothetical protein [Bacteroidales bacterium]